jgi:NADH dehydrogenase (ubiquinone) 1 alpha/beta subcomplex 1
MLVRSAPRAATPVLRTAVAVVPVTRALRQQSVPLHRAQSVRMYSAGGGPLSQLEVTNRIMNILSRFDKVQDASKITEKAHFANDLGLDSLDTVEVVMAIEEEFGIEIPDKDADAIHSIPLAVEYILSQPDAH